MIFMKMLTRYARNLMINPTKPVYMKPLLLALLLICFTASNAQRQIKLEELKEHIGDSVKIDGKISGIVTNYGTANQKPMFIYIGGKYPKQALTIFISPDVRSKLHVTLSLSDVGNIVWVSGKVEKYKGKARIIIRDPRQLDIMQDMQIELE
jgi:hypothetical protein